MSPCRLCYGKDEDGVPKSLKICVKHEKCDVPGASIYDIYPDFVNFWETIKDMIQGIKRTKTDTKARGKQEVTRKNKIKEIKHELRKLIIQYNELPYPDVQIVIMF